MLKRTNESCYNDDRKSGVNGKYVTLVIFNLYILKLRILGQFYYNKKQSKKNSKKLISKQLRHASVLKISLFLISVAHMLQQNASMFSYMPFGINSSIFFDPISFKIKPPYKPSMNSQMTDLIYWF